MEAKIVSPYTYTNEVFEEAHVVGYFVRLFDVRKIMSTLCIRTEPGYKPSIVVN